MGHIQLKIATLTVTKTLPDADMTKVFNLVFEAHAPKWDTTKDPPEPITYTAQQRLEFIGQHIIGQLIQDARWQHAKNKRAEAEAALNEEAKDIKL